jgi:hypothetical protein
MSATASSSTPRRDAQRVVVDRLDAPYYLMHYVGARRIL